MVRVARVAVAFNLFDTTARRILTGLSTFAQRSGAFEIANVLDNQLTVEAWTRLPAGLRGVVAHLPDAAAADLVCRLGLPIVNTSNMVRSPALASVTHDDRAVGEIAAGHLTARRFAHFLFVGHTDALFSLERWAGFSQGLSAQGRTATAVNLPLPGRDPWALEAASETLKTAVAEADKPLAVFAVTDRVGRTVIEACHELGVCVPDGVAVLGVNDDPFEVAIRGVALSSVRLAGEAVGARAAQALATMMFKPSRALHQRVAPAALVTRTSTESCATTDPRLLRALRHQRERLHEVRGVDELARIAGMSRRAFELAFRRSLGVTPGEHLRAFRVERAKTLLSTSDLPPTDIAPRIGLPGVRVFNRLFKDAMGCTPCDFRQRVGGATITAPTLAEPSSQP